jgi:hypothetical protein
MPLQSQPNCQRSTSPPVEGNPAVSSTGDAFHKSPMRGIRPASNCSAGCFGAKHLNILGRLNPVKGQKGLPSRFFRITSPGPRRPALWASGDQLYRRSCRRETRHSDRTHRPVAVGRAVTWQESKPVGRFIDSRIVHARGASGSLPAAAWNRRGGQAAPGTQAIIDNTGAYRSRLVNHAILMLGALRP